MKWLPDLQGKEILYEQGWKFDAFGPGTIKGIETKRDSPVPMIEILLPDSRTIERQFLPVDVFLEGIKKKEIEVTDEQNVFWHQWRKKERELVNKPTAEAVKEVSLFSELGLSILLELLKERGLKPKND